MLSRPSGVVTHTCAAGPLADASRAPALAADPALALPTPKTATADTAVTVRTRPHHISSLRGSASSHPVTDAAPNRAGRQGARTKHRFPSRDNDHGVIALDLRPRPPRGGDPRLPAAVPRTRR